MDSWLLKNRSWNSLWNVTKHRDACKYGIGAPLKHSMDILWGHTSVKGALLSTVIPIQLPLCQNKGHSREGLIISNYASNGEIAFNLNCIKNPQYLWCEYTWLPGPVNVLCQNPLFCIVLNVAGFTEMLGQCLISKLGYPLCNHGVNIWGVGLSLSF